jgi:hypothetical protein
LQQNGDKKKQPQKVAAKAREQKLSEPSASGQVDETCKTWTEQPNLKGQE